MAVAVVNYDADDSGPEPSEAQSRNSAAGSHRGLLAPERDRQGWHDEGREKDRQKPLFAASEGDDLALGRVEGRSSARVSAVAELPGVTPGFDWRLDGLVRADGRDARAVDQDVELATTDLHADEVSGRVNPIVPALAQISSPASPSAAHSAVRAGAHHGARASRSVG